MHSYLELWQDDEILHILHQQEDNLFAGLF